MKSFKRVSILCLFVCCIFSGLNNAQNRPGTNGEITNVYNEPVVTEEFRGDDLKVVLDYLIQETKVNIKYDDTIEAVVTCTLDEIPLNKALEIILSATPYKFKKEDNIYYVYHEKNEALVRKTIAKEVSDKSNHFVTNEFVQDDLLAVLDVLSADTGINIMYANYVEGVISCKLENVPLSKAIEIILAGTPYVFSKRDGYYVITEIPLREKQLQISGDTGIANVKMEGLPGEVFTDENGYYTASVDAGFSGKIQPVKEGYKFNPSFIIYNNISSDRKKQNYKTIKLSSNQTVGNELNEPVVTNEFVGDDLQAVLDILAADTMINIMYDDTVEGMVTCKLTKMPLSKVLEVIFSASPYIIKRMDEYYLITSAQLDDIKNGVLEPVTNQDDVVINNGIDEPVVTHGFGNEDLRFVLNILAMDTGINIMYTDSVEGMVNCKFNNKPLSKALEIVLAATPYLVRNMGGYYLVYSQDYPANKITSPKEVQEAIEPKVTESFIDEDLLMVLDVISSNTGINIMNGENVQGLVNCTLKDVPLSAALEMVLAATPFIAKKRDDYYVVTEFLSPDKLYQISGNAGLAQVKMEGLPGEVYTDANGYYHANVEAGFSGKVQPIKDGYNFNPSYIIYNNLISKRSKQDYQADKVSSSQSMPGGLSDPVISEIFATDDLCDVLNLLAEETGINIMFDASIEGVISCNLDEVPLSKALEVILSATPYLIKKMDSYYLVISTELDDIKNRVASNNIINPVNKIPEKEDSIFSPSASQDIEEKQEITNQDNKSQKTMVTISDTLKFGENKPMTGVEITAEPGGIKTVTNSKGQFSITVPYGWSGKITLSKPGMKFSPDSISYKNVTTDIANNVPVPSKS